MKLTTLWRSVTDQGWKRALLMVLLLAVAMPFAAQAQQYSGTVNGTVTDPGGAAVVGATVTYTNIGTNATDSTTTSDSGFFTFAQLPVGVYNIEVKQTGFKDFVTKNVEVHTSTNTEVDVKLTVGAVTETMTVEATDVQVETTNATVGEVVSGTQVRELPLNGENFMGLVTLSPGVAVANSFDARDKGLTGGADFSVNGNPYNYNLFLVDGVNNNDVGSGRTILVYPSVDAIAEFKMIRNSYGPEYGQAAGAIISITTRSGENQFHGGFFYAGRNDALDANDFFSNLHNTGKAEERRNDYGYHIAGPILKNKLFGWWNQEWNKEVRGQSVSACVPTVAEKMGDFSQDASDIAAGLSPQGSGNCGATLPAIPAANQAPAGSGVAPGFSQYVLANPDPSAQLLAAYYPNPNRGSASNGFASYPTASGFVAPNWAQSENQRPDWSEWNVRVDYDVTSKNRATFRYTNDSWSSPGPNPNLFWGSGIFPDINSNWSQPSKSVMGKLTTQISNTLVNDVEFGYGHNAIVTSLAGTGATVNGTAYTGAGLVSAINTAIPTAFPSSLKNAPALPQVGWGGISPYGNGQQLWTIAPYGNHEDLYALQDNVSKVEGNHLFKVGIYYSSNAKIENNNGGTDQPFINPASYAIATNTNNQLINLLLPGQEFTTSENSINQTARVIWHDVEWYIGDTWKFRHNLTFSYGFRWSFLREPYSSNNEWTSWSLADYNPALPASDACNGIIVVPGTNPCAKETAALAALGVNLPLSAGTPGPNRALVNNNNHDIAPRLGVAWDVRGDGKTAVRAGLGQFFQREPVGLDEKQAFNAPFVINATDVRTLETPAPLVGPAVSPCCSKEQRGITPNSWQWNLSVERELAHNTAVSVGYVGNSAIHLTDGLDLNAVPEADWAQGAFLNSTALNALRPAANFGSIPQFDRGGHATYHSLQALFRTRLSNFSSFQVAYTYSHSIGNVELDNSSGSVNEQAVTDQADPRLDRGNTNINRPHIFVANEVFYLPKFANHSEWVQQSVGGWELNSIINVSSGASLSVFSTGAGAYVNGSANPLTTCSATDIANNTCVLGPNQSALSSLQGSGFTNNQRPNITGTGCNSGVSGYQILNPAAFTVIGYTIGTAGNAPRGYCFGPDNRNVDAQLAKNWTIKEKYRLKFSMDFFNLFNHANFYGTQLEGTVYGAGNLLCGAEVAAGGGLPAHYNPCSATNNVVSGQVGGAGNYGGFGQASQVHPGRELQYTLRFTF